MTKHPSILLIFALYGVSFGESEFRYLTDPDDVRPILQKYSRNPFRYQGIWSTDAKESFLPETGAAAPAQNAEVANIRPEIFGGVRPPSEAFISKVEKLMYNDIPRASNIPISSAEETVQRMEPGTEIVDGAEPHYMRPYLFITAPFLSNTRGRGKIFPDECKLRYSSSNVSEVLLPFDEIELETGSKWGVKEGDQFKIYEVGDDYQSYSSGAHLGRLVRVVGMAEVGRVGYRRSVARMTRCFGTISRQSRAAPIGELPKVKATRYVVAAGALHVGRILWVTPPHRIPLPFSQVIIDGGTEGGFQVGDFVSIFTRSNGKMTDKVLGSAVVLRSEPHSATLMLQEVEPGVIYPGDFAVVHLSATP